MTVDSRTRLPASILLLAIPAAAAEHLSTKAAAVAGRRTRPEIRAGADSACFCRSPAAFLHR